ncbi:MAG: site-2 protease family protein [Zetaproteobacteria bacterium]|nr:site-2 protease family protein [Zetaproteobacteria bacterium]
MDVDAIIRGISIWGLPVLFAVILHEVAHGWVADRLGDNTARFMGRLTLNPFKHIDPIGTILVPLLLVISNAPFLFGYAKPVPVDARKLNHPKKDMVWVALAGPLMNVVLAIASMLMLAAALMLPHSWMWFTQPLVLMCQASIMINLVLFVFNLIPIPPLDGGRIAVGLLPGPLAWQLSRIEPFGFLIIVTLLFFGAFQVTIGPLVMGLSEMMITWAIR